MKFHATPTVIRSLLSKSDPSVAPEVINARISANTWFDSQDMQAVGRETVRSVSHPVMMESHNQYGSWLFIYTIMIDRTTNTVYVKARGD